MSAKSIINQNLSEKENEFIQNLLESGGKVVESAIKVGFAPSYAYALRKKLYPFIVEATEEYLALNALRAASKLVESLDEEVPNPVKVSAAGQILDRIGLSKKDTSETNTTVKANIFILPEKATEYVVAKPKPFTLIDNIE